MEQRPFEQAPAPVAQPEQGAQEVGIRDVNNVFRGASEGEAPAGLEPVIDAVEESRIPAPKNAAETFERVLAAKKATTEAERDDFERYDETVDGVRHVGWRMKYPNVSHDPYEQAGSELRATWERQLRAGEELRPFSYTDDSGHTVEVKSPEPHRVQPIVNEYRMSRVAPPSPTIPAQRQAEPLHLSFDSGMQVRPRVEVVRSSSSTPRQTRAAGLGWSGVTSMLRSSGGAGRHRRAA